MAARAPALYIPHGGGPLPLLDDPAHEELIAFLRAVPSLFARPDAVLVISAHWEESLPTIQAGSDPELLYDYYGFPPESYQLEYGAPGAPGVADRIGELLQGSDIEHALDRQRGFDHGVFVPMLLMYPDASIPCLQLSLREDLDPAAHIALGRALAPLRDDNVLVLGSGSSFHNMTAFRDGASGLEACESFDSWLYESCCQADCTAACGILEQWRLAPQARYAHPREEHLLPLHVCLGTALPGAEPAQRVFNGRMMGFRMSAFLWR